MRRGGSVLFVDGERRLLRIGDAAPVDVGGLTDEPESVAAAVVAAFDTAGEPDRRLVWALSSRECLAAAWSAAETPKAGDRQALQFELENHLPYAAEDLTADFCVQGNSVFAVALPTSQAAPLIEALEKSGVGVASISPLPLLWAQVHRASSAGQDQSAVIAVELCHRWEWLRLAGDHCVEWLSLDDLSTLTRRLAAEPPHDKTPTASILFASAIEPAELVPGRPESVQIHPLSQPLDAIAAQSHDLLSGRSRPWIELRRDRLALEDPHYAIRGALRGLALAACLAITAVIGVLQWQIAEYRRHCDDCNERQTAIFSELFPGKPPPAGIRSRLRGEVDRLRGLSQLAGDVSSVSSYLTLHRLLAALPESVRFRMTDLRLEEGRMSADVTAASHGDVAAVTEALARQGFEVEPARSEQISPTEIAVRIAARLTPSTEEPLK